MKIYSMQKSAVLLIIIIGAICIGVGIIIGYFAIQRSPDVREKVCEVWDTQSDRPLDTCVAECREGACQAESCNVPQPRSYVAYHLQGKPINIDGRINEEAWNDVPWTEDFVDLLGESYPKPHFDTRVKIRWDDTNLYVAAYLQEDNVWPKKTVHDDKVYLDNAFEIYVDTDGTTHNYKEFQINAIETTWDLRLTKAYIDGGTFDSTWESNAQFKVYTAQPVNDPSATNEFWSVEIAIPFQQLRLNSLQPTGGAPKDKDIWRIVLARPEWRFKIVGDKYVKDEDADASWWSWQPHSAVNLHLPDKWGLLQFSRGVAKSQTFTPNDEWKISQALFDTYNAVKKYHGEYGLYTTDKALLDLPQYLLTGFCVGIPEISLNNDGFAVSISAASGALKGHIRTDRYLWFGDLATGLQTV